jgi:hippurate hydrolase
MAGVDHSRSLSPVRVEQAVRQASAVFASLPAVLPGVHDMYFDLHRHPELSGQEERTSRIVATELEAAGYEVTSNVGGYGVVGLLRNGDGPVVAVRGDMDALPVQEKTGLPYASNVVATREDGTQVPVMHACGHDLHTACLVGTAKLFAAHKARWRGTLMIIAQPAEETLSGAPAMLAEGLFTRFPRPHVVLGQHVLPARAPDVMHLPGAISTASNNLRVTIFGVGGHGAQPHTTVDPIVIGAAIVSRLQTIVSRETSPFTPAVVTVGSFHSGLRPNIIPDQAVMEITVRAFDNATAARIVEAVERIVRAECEAGRCPREPKVEPMESTLANINDPAVVEHLESVHRALFGGEQVSRLPFPIMGSEDFALFGVPGPERYPEPAIPTAYWYFGGTGAERWASAAGKTYLEKAEALPDNHSPFYYPDPDPTLQRGIEALVGAALGYLGAVDE